MEELLRFVAIRAAERAEPRPEGPNVIALDTGSDFREQLQAAEPNARKAVAERFAGSDRFVADPRTDSMARALLDAVPGIEKAKGSPRPAQAAGTAIRAAIRSVLPESGRETSGTTGDNATVLAGAVEAWSELEERIKDTLLALSLHQSLADPRAHHDVLRVMHLARQLSQLTGDQELDVAITFAAALGTDLRLVPPSPAADSAHARPEAESPSEGATATLRVRTLTEAADYLLSVPRGYLTEDVAVIERSSVRDEQSGEADDGREETAEQSSDVVQGVTFNLQPDVLSEARPEVRDVIAETIERIGPNVDQVVRALRLEELDIVTAAPLVRGAAIAGTVATGALTSSVLSPAAARAVDALLNPGAGHRMPPGPDVIQDLSRPRFGSLGVGDLLVVRQQLKAYRAQDIAHIENLLRGEKKERIHRRKRLTEETLFTESSTELEEERDTQTSERFELRSEVQEEVKENFKVEAGVKVVAQLGPYVELSADARFAYERARTEGRKRATAYSREVTEKASTRFTEKVLERRERRLVEEIEETNTHALDATDAATHSSGIYQWVSKVYEAQVYNYGLRQMYEFFLPEPAAFYIATLVHQAVASEAPTPPPPFTITPNHLTRSNYKQYAATYNASAVPPPPEEFVKVSEAKAGGPLDFDSSENGNVAAGFVVQLPDGYEYFGYRSRSSITFRGTHHFTFVVSDEFGDPGSVPFLVQGRSIVSWAVWIHVTGRVTPAAMDDWRLKAWEALRDGHAQMQRLFEERLAAAAVAGGVEITGRSPAANERIVREEIRRQCMTALSNASPAGNNGVGSAVGGMSVNWEQAYRRGLYARFLHQAFEWENVSFVFYPFFWARLSRWLELFQVEDVDPQFQAFLQAGFARVVVPVRPGFENHVEHYRRTQEVWAGGEPPAVGDPDFLSVAAEIQANTGAPGSEEPVGEPWEIVLPTALVKVRQDDRLPAWHQDETGAWVEDDADG
ncbi:hypothetical protein [Kocuria sabuli]|uniref:hypothetical protein n=1 Tax=Kocuria sabuli TaxID=3071448 RepID=UPI0034D6D647